MENKGKDLLWHNWKLGVKMAYGSSGCNGFPEFTQFF